MQTNNHKIVDYDVVLDAKFGVKGTTSRMDAEEKAYAFFSGQISPCETHQKRQKTRQKTVKNSGSAIACKSGSLNRLKNHLDDFEKSTR